ncbi:MAG TPA: hypothetical protein VI795_03785 [Patescibacteria group bacterium]|nr:hypothetical protein [Patescibacteria group bacterium]
MATRRKRPPQGLNGASISKWAEPGTAGKAGQIFDEIDGSLPWASLTESSQQTSQEGSLVKEEDSEAIIRREQES